MLVGHLASAKSLKSRLNMLMIILTVASVPGMHCHKWDDMSAIWVKFGATKNWPPHELLRLANAFGVEESIYSPSTRNVSRVRSSSKSNTTLERFYQRGITGGTKEEYQFDCRIDSACQFLYGKLIPAITGFGTIGNLLTTAVLIKMLRRYNCVCLTGLTILNTVLLLAANVVYATMAYCEDYSPICDFMVRSVPSLYPICHITRTCSIFVCVVISLERCYVVKRPLMVRSVLSKRKSLAFLCGCLLGSFLCNIPAFLEFRFDKSCECVKQNPLRSNKLYVILYRGVLSTILNFTTPFIVILITNFVVMMQLRQAYRSRKVMMIKESAARQQQRSSNENTLASILVVLVFLVGQVFPMVNHVIEVTAPQRIQTSYAVGLLVYVGNVLVAFGSAVNIVIYCVSGTNFRREFTAIFCCCLKNRTFRNTTSQYSQNTYSKIDTRSPRRSPMGLPFLSRASASKHLNVVHTTDI